MFSLIDVGERSGSGLCDVFNTWKECGYKKPSIVETLDPDRITITLQIEMADINIKNDVDNDVDDVVSLSTNEKKVFDYLKKHPTASIKETFTALSIGRATVDRAIKTLKGMHYLSREGDAKNGCWIILK